MTDDEARQLATRIIDTWPNGSKAYVWRDLLEPLSAGRAGTAYARLLRDHENARAPSPGQFMALYRSLHTDPASSTDDTPACILCDGTRYVECTDDRRHANFCRHRGTSPYEPGDCGCHAVDPCPHCNGGR